MINVWLIIYLLYFKTQQAKRSRTVKNKANVLSKTEEIRKMANRFTTYDRENARMCYNRMRSLTSAYTKWNERVNNTIEQNKRTVTLH